MRRRIYLLLCATVLIYSCCTSVCTERVADVDPHGWHTDTPARVTVENTDTVAKCDISLLVRVDNTFVPQTLPVVIRTIMPDSVNFEETFNLPLAIPTTMKENYYEALIPYRTDVILDRTGKYTFEISTLVDGVRGIWSVGITIKIISQNGR